MALDKPALAQAETDPFKIVFVVRWLLQNFAAAADLTGFAPINNPVLTGDPKSVTPAPGDNDTSIATTAFTTAAISAAIAAIPPQVCVGAAYAESNTFTSTSATMAGGLDTIPQQTDGAQLLTCSITPKSATNKLRIRALIPVWSSNSANTLAWFALFKDSAAAAIAATNITETTAGFSLPAAMEIDILAGTTSATTIKLRYGTPAGTGGAVSINGTTGLRLLGGAARVTLAIEELAY